MYRREPVSSFYSSDGGLNTVSMLSLTLSTVMCGGCILVTNVLIVSRFGQKREHVNVRVFNDRIYISSTLYNMSAYHSVNHWPVQDSWWFSAGVHAHQRHILNFTGIRSQLIDNQFRKLLHTVLDANQSAGFQFCKGFFFFFFNCISI